MGNEEAAGPEGAGKPGRVGPGREAVCEREVDRVGRVGFLTGSDEKGEGERATEGSGGGVEIFGRPRGRRGASLGRGSSEVG
jgi:hypothetical protein